MPRKVTLSLEAFWKFQDGCLLKVQFQQEANSSANPDSDEGLTGIC